MKGTRPVLAGHTVEWDDEKQQWHAFNEHGSSLHGKDQRDLDLKRNQRAMLIGDELLEICRYAQANGYTPPPRQS